MNTGITHIQSITKGTAVTADTDFGITQAPKRCIKYRVHACMSAAGVLSLRDTTNSITMTLNEGFPLVALAPYEFEFTMDENDSFDFRYSATATVRKFVLYEVINR